MERIHTRLSSDDSYREEYFRLMRKQNPRRYAEVEVDAELDHPAATPSGNTELDAATKESARAKAKALIQSIMNPTAAAAPPAEAAPAPVPEPEGG